MTDDAPPEDAGQAASTGRNTAQDERIAQMRDGGATWLEIQQAFTLTRQQARYAYQRGKREQRRAQRGAT
jgi:hypothetical protein